MDTKRYDIAAILGKGLVGAIPFIGSLLAEIVGATIPNQRIDRLESFLKMLESKIEDKDKLKIESRITYPETIDLIEDSFIQASRALSEARKEYIASLLKNSLTDDYLKHMEYKRLLTILGELNDFEVVILKYHTLDRWTPGDSEYSDFMEKHEKILEEPVVYTDSSQEEIDRLALYWSHWTHLVNLKLLKIKFNKPQQGHLPEFDQETGVIKAQGYEITDLGRLLLRCIDQDGKF